MANIVYEDFIARRLEETRLSGERRLQPEDQARLESMRGRYAGQRCFVVGNGPSLNQIDFKLLTNEYTFGVNKIFLMFDRTEWRPTFYTSVDHRVTPDIRDQIAERNDLGLKIFPTRFKGMFEEAEDVLWFTLSGGGHGFKRQFSRDIVAEGVAGRGSVLVQVIQIAYYLGFSPIYLIGVDVSYSIPESVIQAGRDVFNTGTKLQLTSTRDDDANHFDPRYFGTGSKWHDPNVPEMIRGFYGCRKGVEFYGGQLLNATVGGNLEVLPRVDFASLF